MTEKKEEKSTTDESRKMHLGIPKRSRKKSRARERKERNDKLLDQEEHIICSRDIYPTSNKTIPILKRNTRT